jgi:uncharacterized protein
MIELSCGECLVGSSIEVAATFGKRFMGLMFRDSLTDGSGMLLQPCSSIHMCFMLMALDIVYLDGNFHVLAVQQNLKPWKLGALVKGCKQVLELPAGAAQRCGIAEGMQLAVKQADLSGSLQTLEGEY